MNKSLCALVCLSLVFSLNVAGFATTNFAPLPISPSCEEPAFNFFSCEFDIGGDSPADCFCEQLQTPVQILLENGCSGKAKINFVTRVLQTRWSRKFWVTSPTCTPHAGPKQMYFNHNLPARDSVSGDRINCPVGYECRSIEADN